MYYLFNSLITFLFKDITSKYGSLITWFEKISGEAAFTKAVASITEGKGVDAFKVTYVDYCIIFEDNYRFAYKKPSVFLCCCAEESFSKVLQGAGL